MIRTHMANAETNDQAAKQMAPLIAKPVDSNVGDIEDRRRMRNASVLLHRERDLEGDRSREGRTNTFFRRMA